MKSLLFSALLIFTFSLNAQAPTAVPIPKEPHHHLVLENEYVRVFRVSIPGYDATLLHQHDVPYVYVSLGPADVINAVQGKPEAHLTMADGQVGYSRGGFAHIARTDAGSSFNNVTIELLKPQAGPHNICSPVTTGGFATCDPNPIARYVMWPEFETAEMSVNLVLLAPRGKHAETTQLPVLVVGIDNSQIKLSSKGKSPKLLRAGEVMWFDARSRLKLSNESAETSRLLELTFKNAPAN